MTISTFRQTAMALPDSTRYIPLVIEALRSVNGLAKASAVKQWIAESLTAKGESVPDTILTSGAQKFANDIQWARMYLVNAGLVEPMKTAGYGNWKLTREGWSVPLDEASVVAIYGATALKGKSQTNDTQEAPPEDPQQESLPGTESWEFVLKKILTTLPDKGFERLCAAIMTNNGLLATKVTGQTGDGGVDGEGMLAIDDYGLIKAPVAWQCKRFNGSNNVGSKEVRDFRGAIDGRAKYGLIFTTSSFTPSAEAEARRPGATPVELVGLDRLIDLMRNKKLGVDNSADGSETLEVKTEFFDEYVHPAGVNCSGGDLLSLKN
jgi:restriction system protein